MPSTHNRLSFDSINRTLSTGCGPILNIAEENHDSPVFNCAWSNCCRIRQPIFLLSLTLRFPKSQSEMAVTKNETVQRNTATVMQQKNPSIKKKSVKI